jgi:methionyl-tRNA formyltransferase
VSAAAALQSTGTEPGTVIAVGPHGIDVATGSGVLRLLELQRPGGKRLPVADFLQGFPVATGQRFAPARAN